jgi:hypothetical protein
MKSRVRFNIWWWTSPRATTASREELAGIFEHKFSKMKLHDANITLCILKICSSQYNNTTANYLFLRKRFNWVNASMVGSFHLISYSSSISPRSEKMGEGESDLKNCASRILGMGHSHTWPETSRFQLLARPCPETPKLIFDFSSFQKRFQRYCCCS